MIQTLSYMIHRRRLLLLSGMNEALTAVVVDEAFFGCCPLSVFFPAATTQPTPNPTCRPKPNQPQLNSNLYPAHNPKQGHVYPKTRLELVRNKTLFVFVFVFVFVF